MESVKSSTRLFSQKIACSIHDKFRWKLYHLTNRSTVWGIKIPKNKTEFTKLQITYFNPSKWEVLWITWKRKLYQLHLTRTYTYTDFGWTSRKKKIIGIVCRCHLVEKSHRTTIWNISRFFAVTKNETQQYQLHAEKASYSTDQVETPYFWISYMSRIPIQQTILIS